MRHRKISIIILMLFFMLGIGSALFADINPDGSFGYKVDLTIPPGTRGLSPQLSVLYNSNLDNGMLGVGWMLQGLPSITRDNRFPINYNGTDRYRGTHGSLMQKGAYFYYEKNNFSRLKMTGGRNGNGYEPEQWEENKPDGSKLYYGTHENSKIEALDRNHAIRVWALDRVEDKFGNYYTIQYYQDRGQFYPSVITYTLNDSASIIKNRTIEFVYSGNRIDAIKSYQFNTAVETKKLLTGIIIKTGGEQVRRYEFLYSESVLTGQKQLIKIQEYGSNDELAPPIAFNWQQETTDHYFSITDNPIDRKSIDELNGDGRVFFDDWNGDGKTDFMWFSGQNGNNRWWTSNGDGTFTQIVSENNKDPLPNEAVNELNSNARIYIGDWNGDGLSDVMWYSKEAGNNRWWLSRGNGIFDRISPDKDPIPHEAINELDGYTELFFYDFNGDQVTDLFWYSKKRGVNRLFMNSGHGGFFECSTNIQNEDINELNSYADLRFGDWNGDGVFDILFYSRAEGDNRWWTSNGCGFQRVTNPQTGQDPIPKNLMASEVEVYRDAEILLGDWNGDGLTDVLVMIGDLETNRWFVNKGNGDFELMNTNLDPALFYQKERYLGDWNGDGITDIMFYGADRTNRWYINRGNGQFVQLTNNGRPDLIQYEQFDYADCSGGDIYFGDWNGDGISDMLTYSKSRGCNKWLIKNTVTPPLIATITTKEGSTLSVAYKQNKDFPNTIRPLYNQYPFVADISTRYLVSKITAADGRGATFTKEYDYMNGLVYKGLPYERKKLNFSQITETVKNAAGQAFEKKVTYYNQDAQLSGLPKTIYVYKNGLLQEETSYVYRVATKIKGIQQTERASEITKKYGRYVFMDMETVSLLNTTEKKYSYDIYGNVIQHNNTLTGQPPIIKNMRYYPADETNWIFDRMQAEYMESDNIILQKREYNYNGNYLAAYKTWLNTEDRWLETTYAYDSVGNIIATTTPTGQTTHITYDSDFKTFPVRITKIANGQEYTVWAGYDPKNGKEAYTIGLNGSRADFHYDAFGRPAKTYENGQLVEEKIYNDFASDNGRAGQQHVITKKYYSDNAYTLSREYFDGFNRVYKTETGSSDSEYRAVTEEIYTLEGRLWKRSNPYIAGKESPAYASYEYFGDGSVAKIIYPDGTEQSFDYEVIDGTLKVTEKGPHGITRESIIDSRGKLVERSEGSGMTKIAYNYDVLGRLVQVINGGNTSSMSYDSLNRKLSVNDPNKGLWTYSYYDNGKLKTQKDANGNGITFSYDGLDRVNKVDNPDGTPDIEYTYDDPAIANSKGQVTKITNSITTSYYSYDAKGNVTNWIQEIDGMRFGFSMTYDKQNRMTTKTYPDGKTSIENAYSSSGHLNAVLMNGKALVQYKRTLDGPDINTATRRTGNGVETMIAFNPATYRPTSMKSTNNNGQVLDHANYVYDSIGNMTAVSDMVNPAASETFNYDSLNRLVYAKGIYGEKSYTYDPAQPGNLTKNGNVNLYYNDAAHPHAVTNSTTGAYTYDANGNMLTRKGKVLRYYADNRLKSVGDGITADETYYYDHSGLRTKIMRKDGVVRYNIGGLYEIAKIPGQTDRQTRYIYGLKGDLVAQNTSIESFHSTAYLKTLDSLYAANTLCGLLLKADVKARIIWAKMSNYRALSQAFFIIILLLIGALLFYFRVIKAEKSTSRPWVYRFSPLVLAAFFSVFCVPGCDNGANYGDAMDSSNATTIEETTPSVGNAGGTGEETIADPSGSQTSGSEVITLIDPAVSGGSGSETGGGGSTSGSTSGGSSPEPEINTNGFPVEGWYFFHPNHVNSTALVTDYKGDVVTRLYYTPFGEVVRSHSSGYDITKYKFTGQEEDYASGLHYFKGRFYDPEIGRFVSADSIIPDMGHALSFNRYAYVFNNPVAFSDPDGHTPVIGAIIGAVVGFIIGGTHGDPFNKENWQNFDWQAAVFGAMVGAAMGAIAGCAISGMTWNITSALITAFVSGASNAYDMFTRGGTMTDITVAFAIAWIISFGMNGFGGAVVSPTEPTLVAALGDDFIAHGVVGLCSAYGTNVFTQGYLVVKHRDIKKFSVLDLALDCTLGFLLGGLNTFGEVGTLIKIPIAAMGLTSDWKLNEKKYTNYYHNNIEKHLPGKHQNSIDNAAGLTTDISQTERNSFSMFNIIESWRIEKTYEHMQNK